MIKEIIMAEYIKQDGTVEHVRPANGSDFELNELQGYCGGYVQAVYLHDGRVIWCNEDGKVYGLEINERATAIAEEAGVLLAGDYIVGNVLICKEDEVL